MILKRKAKECAKRILRYSRSGQTYRAKRVIKYAILDEEAVRCIYMKRTGGKYGQIQRLLENITIEPQPNMRFQHWIDESLLFFNDRKVIGNMPPDYRKIIDYSLLELMEDGSEGQIDKANCILIKSIIIYIDRILAELNLQPQTKQIRKAIDSFSGMKTRKANSLEDALQRILFWSSLFWQTGHRLVGLGRLDKVLERFALPGDNDTNADVEILKDFLRRLHEHYGYKSAVLPGDIGQIMVLGGLEPDGSYYSNCLTYEFLKALMELQIPDPKILLRVGKCIPPDLLELAVRCIATGIGSPLLSNDEVVIPALREFGYTPEDAYNYVTSACWEPVSYGNSLEQNNLANINFADVFVQTLEDDSVVNVKSFADFLVLYEEKLRIHVQMILKRLSKIKWEQDPLFTFFTGGCRESGKDIADGGAVYNDYGILSVGMGNAVDSLINFNVLVFEEKRFSTQEIHKLWSQSDSDKEKLEALTEELKKREKAYGHDKEEYIALTDRLMGVVSEVVCSYRNPFGGKVKFGLSSPNYIKQGFQTGYTFDGRRANEPLTVHISAGDNAAYTEIVSFASQLHYTGWNANANVIDFFVSPDFINKNFEKFTQFLQLSIECGFFQMQMNVVSSEQLIEAKKDPNKFPNLIVRVWGFSAYFKDLPEEYQNVLINRALVNEGKR